MEIEILKNYLKEFFKACPQVESVVWRPFELPKVCIGLNGSYYHNFEDWLHEELNKDSLHSEDENFRKNLFKKEIDEIRKAMCFLEENLCLDHGFIANRAEIKIELFSDYKRQFTSLCEELKNELESKANV